MHLVHFMNRAKTDSASHLVVLHMQFFLLALQLVFQVLLFGDVVLDLDHSHVPL